MKDKMPKGMPTKEMKKAMPAKKDMDKKMKEEKHDPMMAGYHKEKMA